MLLPLLTLALALFLNFLWLYRREGQRHIKTIAHLNALEETLKEKEEELLHLRIEKKITEEKQRLLSQTEEQLKTTFQSLSTDALEKNNRNFLELAKAALDTAQEKAKNEIEKKEQAISALLKPVQDVLSKLDQGIHQIEKERRGDQEALKVQMRALVDSEKMLRDETANLVKALRTPAVRGRWGEIQLRRVVELAGMLPYCDFFEQKEDEDRESRPDLLVKLPGGRQVIIDAKVPLIAFLEAAQATDESIREERLKQHAKQLRTHIHLLGKKSYWQKFHPTPEFVVLFLPAETFFSAALEWDPSLIEEGAERNVIIATPTTLIALLRAVAYGWKQENLSHRVEQFHHLSRDLNKRLAEMTEQWEKIGRHLKMAAQTHSRVLSVWENRVLPAARKLKEASEPVEIPTSLDEPLLAQEPQSDVPILYE